MKKILLIEDDRLVAKSIANLLSRPGLVITVAHSGDLALKLVEGNEFDLIISDIRMPGELGTTIVKQINQQRKEKIPFIFVTGYADEKYVQEAEEMGCSDFFFKPFDTTAILTSIQRILNVPLLQERPIIEGGAPPSQIKRLFYTALSSQWNPETEIDWSAPIGIDESLCVAMASILSPIVMGEYSAFNGIPQRILSFSNYEVKQYLAAQLVDETRHAEAFDLYLTRIKAMNTYKRAWRNIAVVRYFNEMKKLTDEDRLITGLLITEVTSRLLLNAYMKQASCNLTQHLFRMILADESRHVSFVSYYLKDILKGASQKDRESLGRVAERVLYLTGDMINHYRDPLKAFGLDSVELYDNIRLEMQQRVAKGILGVSLETHHE